MHEQREIVTGAQGTKNHEIGFTLNDADFTPSRSCKNATRCGKRITDEPD